MSELILPPRVQDWSHQGPATQYIINNPETMLDVKMGGGKTKIVIDAMKHFVDTRNKKFLVFCPSSVIGVWKGQLEKFAPEMFDVVLMNGSGSSEQKSGRIVDGLARIQCGGRPLVIVVNYDLFWREKVFAILSRQRWDAILADEIHRLKSHAARCSKEAWKMGQRSGRRIGMTGTIMPHSPLDIFAQYRFLKTDIFGRYVTAFKKSYAVMNQYIPNKVDSWINQESMYSKINQIRHTIQGDFLVLPEKQDIIIEVPLSPAGRKSYDQMKKESMAAIRKMRDLPSVNYEPVIVDGETFYSPMEDENYRVNIAVASNGAVKFLRLLQLAQGYVGDEDGNEVDTDTQKRKVLLELLEDAGEPVCVYAHFKHDMDVIQRCCEILGLRYGELSGRRKDGLTENSEMREDLDVMGVQCKSGSSGINLTRSSLGIIMNSGMLSPGDYDQMMARQYRPGQTRNVRFIHLVSPKTVDATIRVAREHSRDVINSILNSEEFF
jgi:SNF2 family DNA or RNA helicase